MLFQIRREVTGFLFLMVVSFHPVYPAEYFVTNTLDMEAGSFREAIILANSNPGPDMIGFNIPKSDPNFDSDIGVWTIRPVTPIPTVADSDLVINGVTQRDFIGEDTNPEGPEIQLDGSLLTYTDGLFIQTDRVQILHMIINRFPGNGIFLDRANRCIIAGCYLGVNYNGMQAEGNLYGIVVNDTSSYNSIVPLETTPNIVSGNTWGGIKLVKGCMENVISGNYIGLNRTATGTLGNGLTGGYAGIEIDEGSYHNEIVNNLICGNTDGISLWDAWSNSITNNHIGTDSTWTLKFGNIYSGISLRASEDSTILNSIFDNDIGYNQLNGIYLEGPAVFRNTIRRNRISGNSQSGIVLANNSNQGIAAPSWIVGSSDEVRGTTIPLSAVELFTDAVNQGRIFLGEALSDASGAFSFSIAGLSLLQSVTATVTDSKGNTSMFSIPYSVGTSAENRFGLPGDFELTQNSPNPFNPETMIRFRIPNAESVQLNIYDLRGRLIKTLFNGVISAGEHGIRWRPETLDSGIYLCCLQMHGTYRVIRLVYLK